MTAADAVPAAAQRLARELEEGAAVLEAAGDEVWPQRLRERRMKLNEFKTVDLDLLMNSIEGAMKAMQAIGLHPEAQKLAWSVLDALVISKTRRP